MAMVPAKGGGSGTLIFAVDTKTSSYLKIGIRTKFDMRYHVNEASLDCALHLDPPLWAGHFEELYRVDSPEFPGDVYAVRDADPL